jgi:hypothetical protein
MKILAIYSKQDVGGWTILKWSLREIGWDVAQDRDQWKDLVNTVMNLRFHKLLGSS